MKDRVYVMTNDDAQASNAANILGNLGACVALIEPGGFIPAKYDGYDVVLVFVTDTKDFPSKHLRVLPTIDNAHKHELEFPLMLINCMEDTDSTSVVAIKRTSCACSRLADGLKAALQNVHWRDFTNPVPWMGPKKKRVSRLPRQIQLRRERQNEHAYPLQ